MLPPFVPPSARVPSESLPLITEFVIERGAHVATSASAVADLAAPAAPPRTWTNEDASALPSIDEFLMARPTVEAAQEEPAQAPAAAEEEQRAGTQAREPEHTEPEHAEPEHVQPAESEPQHPEPVEAARPADVPSEGIEPAELEREEGEPIPRAQPEILLTSVSPDASEVKESVPPGARFNDEAGDVTVEAHGTTTEEAWDASAVSPAVAGEEMTEASAEHDDWGASAPEGSAEAPSENDTAWISEERDAYDWQSVATIAAGPDEARRAAEAWEGTEWEPRRTPEQEQIATALVQLARRVRAGELKVDLPANATVEASLAALLAALLADEGR